MMRLLLALVVVVLLAALLLGLLHAIAAVRTRVGSRRAVATEDGGDPALGRAWTAAAGLAGASDHRVARARESCDALALAARQAPFEADLRDCAALVRQIVPDIVAIAAREAAGPPSPTAAARIEEMIDLLDRLGDEADRVRARRTVAGDSPFAVHRAYLDARRREVE